MQEIKKTRRLYRLRTAFHHAEFLLGLGVFALLACFLLRAGALSQETMPADSHARLGTVTAQLNFLERALKQGNAAEEMQAVFPEGACFLLTLYGLAWTNVAGETDEPAMRAKALAELDWTLNEQKKKYVLAPFHDTQVRLGVFALGQRNLLLGRTLEAAPERQRRTEWVSEFHANSKALAEAFLASPTHHLDSYLGDCWPADNVTALASLLIHDRMYGTDYGRAYRAWKDWTLTHPAIAGTALPAGKLDSLTGQHDEPARGCANSWICGVLAAEDPEFAGRLYREYGEHFGIRRLGFAMFREYPTGRDYQADVDSGPIIWGAGMTATGVGLAAARACGDAAMATDIYNLAGIWGWPRWTQSRKNGDGRTSLEKNYLFGCLPMGDAFLAWGLSQEAPEAAPLPSPGKWAKLRARWAFYAVLAGLFGLLGLREGIAVRKFIRWRRSERDTKETPKHLPPGASQLIEEQSITAVVAEMESEE